jgi:N-formylglutamate amidohydrolase
MAGGLKRPAPIASPTDAPAAYELVEPDPARETPVVVEVPHASVFVPADVLVQIEAPASHLARDADLHVDALYADAPDAGATLLRARVSRYVVDLNRGEDDFDAESVEGGPAHGRAPRGVVWRLSGDGARVLSRPLAPSELERRLVTYHRPYHAALRQALTRKVQRFGVAVLLAGHSMPSRGRAVGGELGVDRADVVPGSRGRTSADGRFIDAVDEHARAQGWSVRHDEPYRGGFTTSFYGRPRDRVHAVQVELARRLYMDEDSLVLHTRFHDVRTWCRGLVAKLGALALR